QCFHAHARDTFTTRRAKFTTRRRSSKGRGPRGSGALGVHSMVRRLGGLVQRGSLAMAAAVAALAIVAEGGAAHALVRAGERDARKGPRGGVVVAVGVVGGAPALEGQLRVHVDVQASEPRRARVTAHAAVRGRAEGRLTAVARVGVAISEVEGAG